MGIVMVMFADGGPVWLDGLGALPGCPSSAVLISSGRTEHLVVDGRRRGEGFPIFSDDDDDTAPMLSHVQFVGYDELLDVLRRDRWTPSPVPADVGVIDSWRALARALGFSEDKLARKRERYGCTDTEIHLLGIDEAQAWYRDLCAPKSSGRPSKRSPARAPKRARGATTTGEPVDWSAVGRGTGKRQ